MNLREREFKLGCKLLLTELLIGNKKPTSFKNNIVKGRISVSQFTANGLEDKDFSDSREGRQNVELLDSAIDESLKKVWPMLKNSLISNITKINFVKKTAKQP